MVLLYICLVNNDSAVHLHFVTDLSRLLKALNMEKYEEIFKKEEIDLELFLTMSEEEFAEIGITTLGARRKLSIAIKGVLTKLF